MKNLKQYQQELESETRQCPNCGEDLDPVINSYDDKNGMAVDGLIQKQHLYLNCTHCSVQTSLSDLGISE